MAWLSRNDLTPSDRLYADQLNSLSNDIRAWGGDVNGGGHHLSNIILDVAGGSQTNISPLTLTPGTDGQSALILSQGSNPGSPRWELAKTANPENPGNLGSDFAIQRFDNNGNLLGSPLQIRRSDGTMIMGPQLWSANVDGGGHVLSNVTIAGVLSDPTTTKGDLIVRGTQLSRLGVGGDGQILTADSSQPLGLRWAAAAPGGVVSVFGRAGAVVAQTGDYTAAQVGAVPTARQVIAGAGLSGGGPLSADVTLTAPGMGASGGAHRAGLAPDPGATTGTTRYLREDATWAVPTGGLTDPTTTLGDLIVRGSAATTRLAVGANGQILMADSTQALGVKWASVSASPVTSVFSRTGTIVAQAGDYTAAQVLNAADTSQAYSDPSWIASLAWSKITGAPSFFVDPTIAKGDLIARGATSPASRLAVGLDGQLLMVDSAQVLGVKWTTLSPAQIGAAPASRQVLAGAGLTGGGTLSADITLSANVTTVFGRTGAVTLTSADIAAGGGVPAARQVIAGAGLSGGGALNADVTLSALLMGASGPTHRTGTVPDPGVTLGATRYLREDATWAIPAGAGGGLTDPTTTTGDLIVRGAAATTRLGVGSDGQVLTADATQALGVKWASVTAGSSQSPWTQNIDAGQFELLNAATLHPNSKITSSSTAAAAIELRETGLTGTTSTLGSERAPRIAFNWSGLGACQIGFDPGSPGNLRTYSSDGLAYCALATGALTANGDCNITGAFKINGTPINATMQTPWVSDIDAASHNLSNVATLSVTNGFFGSFIATSAFGFDATPNYLGMDSISIGWYTYPGPKLRWLLQKGGTESTGNAGSDLNFSRYDNAGNFLGIALGIVRASGLVVINNGASVTGDVNITGTYKVNGTAIFADPTTTKGDIIARGASAPATRLAAGTNGQVLTADSAQALGVKWSTAVTQTPWTSNIDAAGYTLGNTGNIGIGTVASSGGATLDVLGPHTSTGILRVKGSGGAGFVVLDTTTAASALSGVVLMTAGNKMAEISYNNDMSALRIINWVASPSWLSVFTNGRIGVNTDTPATAFDINGVLTVRQNTVINGSLGVGAAPTTNVFCEIGDTTRIIGGTLTPTSGAGLELSYSQGAGSAYINAYDRSASAFKNMSFSAAVYIFNQGPLQMPNMPTTNPGAGSKRLWADPADGYRVKFAV